MLQDPIKEQELESKIINLRLQGMSEGQIAKQLKKEVEQLENLNVEKFWERIYFICRNINIQKDANLQIKDVTQLDETIWNLSQIGKSYDEILNQLENQGVKTSIDFVVPRYTKIRMQRGVKLKKAKAHLSEDRIFELREQKLSHSDIAKQLAKEGIYTTASAVNYACEKIYAKKNMRQPILRTSKINVSEDRIFELREQKLSYKEMIQQLKKEGVNITYYTLNKLCKKIYAEKNMKEPVIRRNKIDNLDDKIFELRQQKNSHEKIVKILMEEGIQISSTTVMEKCKRIYAQKNMEEPKAMKRKILVSEDRIFELREQKLTYKEIAQQLVKEGVYITHCVVNKLCKKIYAEKNMEEPVIRRNKIDNLDDKIFELRQKSLSYVEIRKRLKKERISIAISTIYLKCKKIYAEKNMEEPKLKVGVKPKNKYKKRRIDFSKMDEEKILHIFSNIQHRKKATREQIEKLAQNYGIDYAKLKEKNEKIRY